MLAKSEDLPIYMVERDSKSQEDQVIQQALDILQARLKQASTVLHTPSAVKDYLKLKFTGLEHEVFTVLYLNSQNGLIEAVEMFRGTLTQTSVYPREVVKEALKRNAAAVVFTHNHPSGVPTPSRADEHLTHTLKAALALVDVRVVDHIIVAGALTVSMAEMGLV
jgi:DNA repair protein RadC